MQQIDKRLQLGGMQVGGPRTAQNPARFRVAANVYQTKDDLYVPRNGGEELLNLGVGEQVLASHSYKGYPFFLVYSGGTIKFFYNSTTALPSTPISSSTGFSPAISTENDSVQFSENLGCLFIHIPKYGLYKFDGAQVYRAGVPLPYFGCVEKAYNTGVARVRLIQHHIDFAGNIVNSGYVQFRATPAANKVHIRVDKGAPDIVSDSDPAINSDTFRRAYDYATINLGYDSHFFVYTSAVVDTVAREVTVTTAGDHNVVVGEYLLTQKETSLLGGIFTFTQRATAFKVKAFTATTVVLDMNDAKGLTQDYQWKTENTIYNASYLSIAFSSAGGLRGGTNYWTSVWCSDSSTGVFVYREVIPNFYDSAVSHTAEVDLTASLTSVTNFDVFALLSAFNLVVNLGEFYDVTSSKQVFPFGDDVATPPKSYTTYQEMALIAYSNEVFFSDTTLAGAFEMTNGLAFIVVGSEIDREIQSICGNDEFFLVSRKLKNYYVSGSLPTAGYRRQALSGPTVGTYSNASAIATEDKIIFLTKQGVFALYYGAKCEEISASIKEIFDTFSATTNRTEETYFNLNNLPVFASDEVGGRKWMKTRFDAFRRLLLFIKGDGQNLVLNLNNGEFYTWSGMTENELTPNYRMDDITFIDGKYYLGTYKAADTTARVIKEVLGLWFYQATSPCIFISTWMTNGDPSLEKKGCQVKLWGLIEGSVEIGYFVDWKETLESDLFIYTNSTSFQMSHKQQIKPVNFLAWSYQMKLEGGVTKFELEGVEVEYTPIQAGMKR